MSLRRHQSVFSPITLVDSSHPAWYILSFYDIESVLHLSNSKLGYAELS